MSIKNFKSDREFLEKHQKVILLEDGDARLLVCPFLQGRVFTSTAEGDEGFSFGWINYDLIRSGKILHHCNNWGGEDRYWIGPEGGQFSIFFKPGAKYDLQEWQTPAPIDTESWRLISKSSKIVSLTKSMELPNTSNNIKKVKADRDVILFDKSEVENQLDITIADDVRTVGFKSVNKMTNENDFRWDKETGMLSIWILGQLISTEKNTVIIPFETDAVGDVLNDTYFGKIDDDRIKVKDGTIYFKGDGKKRGKIGVGPERVKPIIGSYDEENNVLTIVRFSFDKSKTDYVNSMWEHQDDPFSGDVVNSYNDGPLPDGSQMGPFYELESSSAAANLAPGETMIHEHATFHFQGEKVELEKISKKILGVGFESCF